MNLFPEFEEISAKQWKQKIQFELQGADYNEKLVWNSPEGIPVRPFYHFDEPVPQTKTKVPGSWKIVEQVYVSSPELANKRAKDALRKGAESIWFLLPSPDIDLKVLCKGLDLAHVPVYLKPEFHSASFFDQLKEINEKGSRLFLQTDIIGHLARTGNWFHDLGKDHELFEASLGVASTSGSVISIDSSLYQNAGASIPQQLAYALAHANEYLNHLAEKKGGENTTELKMTFQFLTATGPNYFFEIAKLRALRLLVETLSKEYPFSVQCHILAQPSRRNKTLYDFNVNLLRTTTECMSAILGGADAICNMAYDAIYHKNNAFGSRIARNQLLILKHESYFEKVVNPVDGSYYVENLTRNLADNALGIFKEIEKGGGFLKQLKDGVIQRKITESAEKEQAEFDAGRLVLIGTNKYPNPEDRMKEDIQLYPFMKHKPRKTLLSPILEKRLAEKTEQERLHTEA